MKLPFSFGQKKEPTEYFVALLLRDETISVVVLKEKAGILELAGKETASLSNTLEAVDLEEILECLDKAITNIENQLPPNANLYKTVFGLKETWVEDAHIKKDYLAKLKKISEELELKPIGFLVFSEAIAHLLMEEEGAPVSAILVETGEKSTTVSILRGGRVTETHTIANQEHLAKTIETLLGERTNADVLPSRILLFASEESSKSAHALLSHTWNKDLPFLHVPQVHVLSKGFDIKAVVAGTAAQLGFSVDVQKISPDEASLPISAAENTNRSHEKSGEVKKEDTIATDNFTAADFGFSTDEKETPSFSDHETESPEKKQPGRVMLKTEAIEEIPEEETEKTTGAWYNKESFARDGMLLATGVKQFFTNLRKKKTNLYTPPEVIEEVQEKEEPESAPKKFPKILIALPVLAVLFVAGVIWYIFNEKAIITLTIAPTSQTDSADVVFAADQGNNFTSNQISGSTTSLSEDGTLQAPATGKKDVGDKAKGTVTIYNSDTSSDKTVSAGTTLTSSNNLKFTTDNDVDVASASGDIFSGTKPGTADVTVTASDIGTDSNLPSGTTFSISGSTTLAAKNANPFSGGTQKQVTVVSKDDESKLVDQLTKNLQSKAQEDMNSQANGDKSLLPVFLNTTTAKKNFDKNVGDEAASVTLTESISFEAIAYAKQDMQDFAQNIMQSKLDQNQSLAPNGISTELANVKQKDDKTISATVNISAKIYSKLDTSQLVQTVKGEDFTKAENFLGNQPQVSHVDITLQPNLFFLPQLLPRSDKNISVVVKQG